MNTQLQEKIMWLKWFNDIGIRDYYQIGDLQYANHNDPLVQSVDINAMASSETETSSSQRNFISNKDISFNKGFSEGIHHLKSSEDYQVNQESIKNCKTLEELRELLMSFDGVDLKKTATNTVFGEGNRNADVMLVGEAPGADEDREGKPFCGQSGQLLNRALNAAGIERETVYVSNICPWRPPGNRLPTPLEIKQCLPFIQRHIELINPKILVCVGGTSTKALLGSKDGIIKLRGQWTTYTSEGLADPILCLPIFHPAFLLRSPGQKAFMWRDLLSLKHKISSLGET